MVTDGHHGLHWNRAAVDLGTTKACGWPCRWEGTQLLTDSMVHPSGSGPSQVPDQSQLHRSSQEQRCWVLSLGHLEAGSPHQPEKPPTSSLVKERVLWGTGDQELLLLQGVFLYQHLFHLHLQPNVQLWRAKSMGWLPPIRSGCPGLHPTQPWAPPGRKRTFQRLSKGRRGGKYHRGKKSCRLASLCPLEKGSFVKQTVLPEEDKRVIYRQEQEMGQAGRDAKGEFGQRKDPVSPGHNKGGCCGMQRSLLLG